MLIAAAFLDELWTGVPVIEAPAVERAHALAHGGTAITLFVVPMVLGAILEARLLLWAERGDHRRWRAAMQVVTAAGALAAALATTPWMLALALGVTGPAAGVVCSLAQAALVDASPDARERAMTRWTLAAALGDLCAPACIGVVAWLGGSWRAALAAVAALLLVHALVLARTGARTAQPEDEAQGERASLRGALRNRLLVTWLAFTTLCALLDEILVALAMLHLRQDRGASEAEAAWAAAAWAAGCGVGLFATDRVLARTSARRLLGLGALGCAIACTTWWLAPTIVLAALGLFVLGLCTAPLYPIARARCYAAMPGNAVMVGVATQLFAPLEIGLPWLLGVLADAQGLPIALVALALGPIGLGALALVGRAWR
ncbi:MAG TPA: MFS transporter [Nannocystaceae bacterium]|nr:MFS transporter [Nannocystaceae bacterium]